MPPAESPTKPENRDRFRAVPLDRIDGRRMDAIKKARPPGEGGAG